MNYKPNTGHKGRVIDPEILKGEAEIARGDYVTLDELNTDDLTQLREAVQPVMEAAEAFHYDAIEGEEDPAQARAECLADERCSYLRNLVRDAVMRVVLDYALAALEWVDEREITPPDRERFVCQKIADLQQQRAALEGR